MKMRKRWPTNSPSYYKTQNKDCELSHPNILFFSELLGHEMGWDLQIQSYRISITQGMNWMSKRSPNEGQLLIK